MFINAHDNILIIGSSDLSAAPSIYYLEAGNYVNPAILQTGLGRRVWCISEHEGYIYYSDHDAIRRFSAANGPIETFLNKSVQSISFGGDFLYYVDYFDGELGRIDLGSGMDELMLSGLQRPRRSATTPQQIACSSWKRAGAPISSRMARSS